MWVGEVSIFSIVLWMRSTFIAELHLDVLFSTMHHVLVSKDGNEIVSFLYYLFIVWLLNLLDYKLVLDIFNHGTSVDTSDILQDEIFPFTYFLNIQS